jgi:hypothetical protein
MPDTGRLTEEKHGCETEGSWIFDRGTIVIAV